jgi:hypothetical protein
VGGLYWYYQCNDGACLYKKSGMFLLLFYKIFIVENDRDEKYKKMYQFLWSLSHVFYPKMVRNIVKRRKRILF